jgi:hypothetical protein
MKKIIILLCFIAVFACDDPAGDDPAGDDPAGDDPNDVLSVVYNTSNPVTHQEVRFSVDGDAADTYTWSYKLSGEENYYIIPNIQSEIIDLYFVKAGEYNIKAEKDNGEYGIITATLADNTPSTFKVQHTFVPSGNNYTVTTTLDNTILTVITDTDNNYIFFDIALFTISYSHVLYGYYEYDKGTNTITDDENSIDSLTVKRPDEITNPITIGTVTLPSLRSCYSMDMMIIGKDAIDDVFGPMYNANSGFAVVLYDNITAFNVYYE